MRICLKKSYKVNKQNKDSKGGGYNVHCGRSIYAREHANMHGGHKRRWTQCAWSIDN